MNINVVKALIFHKIDDAFQLLILTRSNQVRKFPRREDLPGGKVNENEDIFSALTREIYEETHLEVDEVILLTTHIWPEIDNPAIQYKEHVFCSYSIDIKVKLNPEEHTSFSWIKLNEINKTTLHPNMKKIILDHQDKILAYITTLGDK